MKNIIAPIVHFAIFRIMDIVNLTEYMFAYSESMYKLLLVPGFERFRYGIGVWRAWRNFGRAYRKVPAYKDFIDKNGGKPQIMMMNNLLPNLKLIPEMDKKNYVKQYSSEQRSVGGRLPARGVMVDESSGSSGTPTSWVRGPYERSMTRHMLQLSYHRAVGNDQTFVINAFALGAWATGINVTMSLTDISILKSTGPDLDKIIHTLEEFGPNYHYIIMGYPPFLKNLADDPRIDWKKYRIEAVFGGEGISESIRDYLLKTFSGVVGSYGASDLEINMAAENEFTIALRKLIQNNETVRNALTHEEYGVTPMVFMYNPLAYFFETNEQGELVVTLCRPTNIAPKIRYNIHDRGHVIRFGVLKNELKKLGHWNEFKKIKGKTDLPILFLYGRSDMSIDYYGANVTPDGIREVLYGHKTLAKMINTFRLMATEKKANQGMEIAIELTDDSVDKLNQEKISEELLGKLADINRDFNNALNHTAPKSNLPVVSFHNKGTGPFEGGQRKLKNEYVTTETKYDKL